MFRLYLKTWKNLKLILFVPDFIIAIVNIILAYLFVNFSGLGKFISGYDKLYNALPFLGKFISENIFSLVFFGLLFLVFNFVIGSGILSIKYGLMGDIVNKKKLKFVEYSREYTKPIIILRFLIFLLISVLLLIITGVSFLIFSLFSKGIGITILLVLFFIILFILKLILLYRYPAMFLKDRSAFFAIRNSFLFFKRKSWITFGSFLVLVLNGLFLAILSIMFVSLFKLIVFNPLGFIIVSYFINFF